MNRKQLISMWCGIALITFISIYAVSTDEWFSEHLDKLLAHVCSVALVTAGLVITFKDRHKAQPKHEQRKPVDYKGGFKRITLVLALVTALICMFAAVTELAHRQDSANRAVSQAKQELESARANSHFPPLSKEEFLEKYNKLGEHATQTGRAFAERYLGTRYSHSLFLFSHLRTDHSTPDDDFNPKMRVVKAENRLQEARQRLWVRLSKESFIGLCVVAGICGAVVGFGGVWVTYLVILLFCRLVSWLTHGFRIKPS